MSRSLLLASASIFLGLASAQSVGTNPEVHPKLQTWKCTKAGGCVAQNTAVVLDASAHWIHQKDNPSLGCGNWGSKPDAKACPDQATCQKNCIMEGQSDYKSMGVTTDGGKLRLEQLKPDGSVVSPRVYLLAEGEKKYEMLKLTGQEFAFDVDVSKLPCGMNGALYLSEMEENGGQSALNTGGAAYGTGYCDAQCFVTPFVNGVGNIAGKGACCNELDIWESNSRSNSLAPHTCNKTGLYQCEGAECEFEGVCDEWGCVYNPSRVGKRDFYGLGMAVDTTRTFTVVTQFPTDANGKLKEIHRLYVQNGKVIQNAAIAAEPTKNFMDDAFCKDARRYMELGGTAGMGEAMSRGMVLCMSVWWDEGGGMQWLDSVENGPCTAEDGYPADIRAAEKQPSVVFSNIKWGEIGSTFSAA